MATRNWLSRAAARAQVTTLTPANVEVGDVFTVTINGKSISVTATVATVANVTGLLTAAWNASTITEFAEITAVDSTTHVTLTGDTAGVPFTVTASATDGGGANTQTLTAATTTAATGPNHWDDANNWSGGAVPVDGDDVNISLIAGSIFYGLGQSSIQPASLFIFTSTSTQNTIGLPATNAGGYNEYRDDYLQIGPVSCKIYADSPRIKLDFGTDPVDCEVILTGTAANSGSPAVFLKGSNVANTLEVVAGTVGVGFQYAGGTINGSILRIGRNGTAWIGDDATISTIESSGTLNSLGQFTDLEIKDGNAEIRGALSAPGSIVVSGGTLDARFSGTVPEVTVGPGTLDCSNDTSPRTFSATILKNGGTIIDPDHTITHTTGIEPWDDVRQVTAA